MAIIGNTVTSVPFIADSFSGNASTTSFSPLTRAPAGTAAIAVFIAGVYQAPGTYTLSGVTITFASAPASGVGNIIVLHLGNGSATQVPSDGSVTTIKLSNDTYSYINAAFTSANAAFATANTGTASGSYANSAFATANTGTASGSYANSAFATANTGTAAGSYANSAFASANLISGVNTTQNTNITSAASYANGAFTKANSVVTSAVAGTGVSVSAATGAVTFTNSGVTSIVAGSGISISGATGAVTVTASGGGVTSLNGQTGALTLTDAGAIGALGIFMNAGNSNVVYGGTVAGSSLRYDYSYTGDYTEQAGYGSATNGRQQRQSNSSYNGGGSSISGTWRKLSSGLVYATAANCCGTVYYWMTALYVRVS